MDYQITLKMMIDTVVLKIDKNLTKELAINGPKWQLHSNYDYYQKFVKNSKSSKLDQSKYIPRLKGISRGSSKYVQIELSLPKLVYGNNLDELNDNDFDLVIELLQDALKEQGVYIERKYIAKAQVTAIHFSKNFNLGEGYRVSKVLDEIRKSNALKTNDISRFKYTNDGQSLQIYNKSWSMVFYDKLLDLQKGKTKAVDKDENHLQKSLFNTLNQSEQILRYELRLIGKRKLSSELKKIGVEIELTLHKLFSNDIAMRLLRSHFGKYVLDRGGPVLQISSSNYKQLLENLMAKCKPTKALSIIGALAIAQNYSLQELRNIVEPRSTPNAWYRIAKSIRDIDPDYQITNSSHWIIQMQEKLKNYKPYKYNESNRKTS